METPSTNDSNTSIGNPGQEQWNPDPNQPREHANESSDEQKNPSRVEKEEDEIPNKWPLDQNAYDESQQDEVHEEYLTPSGNRFEDIP
ncbi:hypothetical protein [Runella slithyformis]|uniref:Uncharacterized protein n=1 Tax=Runella slithyformis (strain ATCC 29530 / DSM 19594 / LMG 11500 / NCIMB 11436 / LSU 4) TaxID=761193 RepID=A0A7U3ZLM7_RUNSL|nr:hypothetical protein [Runella slithyformis]AEI49470.1 hypothetical protein Runsl_3086 [Runella slithyformis DSM 19594]